MKILFLKGLPASGKSTYAKEMAAKGYKRINKDDLRAMIDNSQWSEKNEKLIRSVHDMAIVEALSAGYNVVIDNSNLRAQDEEHMRDLTKSFKPEIEVKFFDTPVDECIRRDSLRSGSARVGEKVIRKMYQQHLRVPVALVPRDPQLDDIVICDLDGTLAQAVKRGWYDKTGYITDELDDTVARLLMQLPEEIIFVSGRMEDCRKETQQWLDIHAFNGKKLYMRAAGDTRNDTIVKQELYEQHIKGKYNVRFVLDDRSRVVSMWRSQGLKCLQVADGNF